MPLDWYDNWNTYEWIVVVGGIVAFMMAWSIGANDVANAFGTTVGAKTITLWQACLIATCMEFAGAVALGGEVVKTISGGIANSSYFYEYPEFFMYGMLCALTSSAFFVTVATYMELAVSTTHSIIGAVVGFSLVFGGSEAVIWNDEKDTFPYRSGITTIVISWFTSPIISGLLAAFIFFFTRLFILRRANSTELAYWALPPLVFITVFINIFFVLYKGAKAELAWGDDKAAWVSAIVAACCTAASIPVVFYMKRKVAQEDAAAAENAAAGGKLEDAEKGADKEVVKEAPTTFWGKVKAQAIKGLTADVHEDVHLDEAVTAMHANAEVFEPRTEAVFSYLQVFSACCVSFAHGANDVANAVGPFCGIWYVYNNGRVSSSADVPKWILALGGAGIVIGLGTYGYNIMKVLGVKMAKMTPSRGYSAELATALTVSVCSVYGLPISTTQCIVGAEMGVGLVDNHKTGANWKLFGKTMCAWVVTLIISAAFCAAIFAQGAYAPSMNMADGLRDYRNALSDYTTTTTKVLDAANVAVNQTAGRFDTALNKTTNAYRATLKKINDQKNNGYSSQYDMVDLFRNVTYLYGNNSVISVGYNTKAATKAPEAITVPKP